MVGREVRTTRETHMDIPHRMIAHDGQHQIEIRKSRFVCSLFRAISEEHARSLIEAVRKQYWDANHNCTAWAIGPGLRFRRSSDDGEPSGTAGIPMLEVLRRRGITDTVAVVTRYFGGTKLGAGGLIRAYAQAVSTTIDEIGVVERKALAVRRLIAPYDEAGRIENAIRAGDYPLADVIYHDDVTFELIMEHRQVDSFQQWIREFTNGALDSHEVGEQFVEVPASGIAGI